MRCLRSERKLTGIGSSDRKGQLISGTILEHVANSAGHQRSLHLFLLLEAGQCNYLDIRTLLAHLARNRRPIHA